MRGRKYFIFAIISAVFVFAAGDVYPAGSSDEIYELQRDLMVRDQIQKRGVKDERVLDAMRTVPRHLFVPGHLRHRAYHDTPLPIGFEQTISQPYIVAFMTEAVSPGPRDKVLEIGSGSGYQAAVMSLLTKEVYTIEIIGPLAEEAAGRVKELGYENVYVMQGDGYNGHPDKAPYDIIIVTAAPPSIPQELKGQLKVGGRMIVPVGQFYQELYLIERSEDGYTQESILPVRFVPMVRGLNKKDK